MKPLNDLNVLVVYKRSKLSFYENTNDVDTVNFMHSSNPLIKKTIERYKESHAQNERAIATVCSTLDDLGVAYNTAWRASLDDSNGRDLIIAVGGDGTVIEAAHHVRTTPILGLNSDPANSEGFYNWTTADRFPDMMTSLDTQPVTTLQQLELTLDGKCLPIMALNDIHIKNDRSAMVNYILPTNNTTRVCKDDGLLVCAPGGATAYMHHAGGVQMRLDDIHMQYRGLNRIGGERGFSQDISVTAMTHHLKIFIDGEHSSYNFGLSHELRITLGSPVRIYGDLQSRADAFWKRPAR